MKKYNIKPKSMCLFLLPLLLTATLAQAQLFGGHLKARHNYLSFRLGGSLDEQAECGQPTADGGYILAVSSRSSATGDVSGTNKGGYDYWIVKVDAKSNIVWEKSYGGSDFERPYSIQQTADGGYIVAGYSLSSANGDVTGSNKGSYDYWILKLDASGNKVWDKLYGGSSSDIPYSIEQTADGGYIVAGNTSSSANGDVTGINKGQYDYWILKLNASGNKVWDKRYGGSNFDTANSIQQTTDGGYIVAGESTSSATGDVTGTSRGSWDYWILKLDASGNKVWDKLYGGSENDTPQSIQQTTDGGYIVAGSSSSSANGDVTDTNKGSIDAWIVKLDASGNKVWDKLYGGSNSEVAYSIQQTADGGYIIAAYSESSANGDVSGTNKGTRDYWIVKLDASGNKVWDKSYGGIGVESAQFIQQTADGGYFVLGSSGNTSARTGDQIGLTSRGSNDIWVLLLDSFGNIKY